ncbi:MAG: glycosyltransferase [Clostridiales bacterium]|nr:glycosyltransferase [Clostridiales bacterium]
MQTISFVIPCYASEGSVALVMDEIRSVVAQRPEYDYEIVAVNDCSPDGVLGVLRQQAAQDRRVKVIDLAKNGGRHNALMCGCHYTTGDYVAFIDDDLQCPTDRFWDLLAPLESGDYDVSIAKYPKKTQSGLKNFGSKVNDTVANWLLGKDKDLKFSNYSVMRRFVKDEVIRYTNPYPYLSGLMLRATSRVTNVVMEERERTIGVGHYNFKKSFALWMNSFTAFSVKPLRLATTMGVICAFVGVITGIYTVIHKFLVPTVTVGYSSLMAAMLFLGGMIMFLLGLIGEYIGRIYISLNNSPQYVVRETLNVEEASVR